MMISNLKIQFYITAFSFSILLPVLMFTACDLSPAGDHYVEVDQPEENPDATFTITPNPDTLIYIFSNMTFNVTPQIGNRIMRQLNVYIDQEWYKSENVHRFSIDPNDFETGIHLLEIEIIFSSGTGSLSDIVGAENYITSFTREVYMDAQIPEPVDINSVIINENGRLSITWNKFESVKFEKYVLFRTLELDYNMTIYDTVEIFDMHQNYWIDSTVIYGKATYFIKLYAHQTEPLPGQPGSIFIGDHDCRLFISANPPYMLDAYWEETPVFGNLQDYSISISNPEYQSQIFVSENPYESDTLIHVGMRKTSIFSFKARSGYSNSFQSTELSYEKEVEIGYYSQDFQLMSYAPMRSYALWNQKIYALETGWPNFLDISNGIFTTSDLLAVSNNEHFIATNRHSSIAFLNPEDLKDVEFKEISHIIGTPAKLDCAGLADNGNLVASLDNGEIIVYNYPMDSLLFRVYKPGITKVISDFSGMYFLTWNETDGEIIHYQYANLSAPVSTQIGLGYSCPALYIAENEARFVAVKNEKLEVWSLENPMNIQNMPVDFDLIVNIDNYNYMFAVDNDHFHFQMFDLDEMELVQSSPTDYANEYLMYSYPFIFVTDRKFKVDL